MPHAVVLVLGDLGRSPRMQYHALSLANFSDSMKVTLIGYQGERTIHDIANNPKISIIRLSVWEFEAFRKISIVHAFLKGLGLLFLVFLTLLSIKNYKFILVQNPPCIPAILAANFVSWLNGSHVMIDWHNLGFSMFSERLGKSHPLVKIAKYLEGTLALYLAANHLCVSGAMKKWLECNFSVRATVLYDRPPAIFKRCSPSMKERHELMLRLGYTHSLFHSAQQSCERNDSVMPELISTIQTIEFTPSSADLAICKSMKLRKVALLISSTSWSPDEDFNMLIDAMLEMERFLLLKAQQQQQNHSYSVRESNGNSSSKSNTSSINILPVDINGYNNVLVIVTGKGPLKSAFEDTVAKLTSKGLLNQRVVVRTAWLTPEDYPLLMRCADLGICMHTSTSGLDLPMKVLDMFGSGVPVCAYWFSTLPELLQHGVNGLSFQNSNELAQQVIRLLLAPTTAVSANICRHDDNDIVKSKKIEEELMCTELSVLRSNAAKVATWEDNWNSVMKPILSLVLTDEL